MLTICWIIWMIMVLVNVTRCSSVDGYHWFGESAASYFIFMLEKEKFSKTLVSNTTLMWLIAKEKLEIVWLETSWRRQSDCKKGTVLVICNCTKLQTVMCAVEVWGHLQDIVRDPVTWKGPQVCQCNGGNLEHNPSDILRIVWTQTKLKDLKTEVSS